jgi:hypothetical protein
MKKLLGVTMLLFGLSGAVMAQDLSWLCTWFGIGCPVTHPHPVAAPEIDAASAAGALALLSGGVLVIRSRRKKAKNRS